MTPPSSRAREIADRFFASPVRAEELAKAIESALAETYQKGYVAKWEVSKGEFESKAVLEERERAAKIAEQYKGPGCVTSCDGEEIAAAIRQGPGGLGYQREWKRRHK